MSVAAKLALINMFFSKFIVIFRKLQSILILELLTPSMLDKYMGPSLLETKSNFKNRSVTEPVKLEFPLAC